MPQNASTEDRGIIYHYRVKATNWLGTTYGDDMTFTTSGQVPTVTTIVPSSVTSTTALSGGTITSDGGATVTSRGVCWSEAANPTTADSYTTDGTGTGSFSSSVTGLEANTYYHIRAYAVNEAGTAYSNDVRFETAYTTPTVTTTDVSSITITTASSGGNVLLQEGNLKKQVSYIGQALTLMQPMKLALPPFREVYAIIVGNLEI